MSDPASSFILAVQGTMARHQCSWKDAWDRTRALQPDLYERLMTAKSPRIVQMANASDAIDRRAAARDRLISKIHEAMDRKGMTYDQAWHAIRASDVNLYNEAVGNSPAPAGIQDAIRSGPSQGGLLSAPVWGPQNLALLGLPANTEREVADAAWLANGRQVELQRPKQVWQALIDLCRRRNPSRPNEADAYCRERFPIIHRFSKNL